jgi:HD-like signal output (HDOD) protein
MSSELEVLDRETEQIVNEIGIPPCPALLTRIMREMREDDPDIVRLGKLIGSDVSIAAAMLKTVNSPFYGLRSRATTVQQAITLLGLLNVARIVTGLLLRQAFPGGGSDILEEYWESSSAIALASALLARRVPGCNRDEAYTFALFRDCGILAMLGHFKHYKPQLSAARDAGEEKVTDAEERLHGINHARLGARFAEAWLLPHDVAQAILWHHEYDALADGSAGVSRNGRRNIALALVAQFAYSKHAAGVVDAEWQRGGAFALAQLGLDASELDALGAEIMREVAAN